MTWMTTKTMYTAFGAPASIVSGSTCMLMPSATIAASVEPVWQSTHWMAKYKAFSFSSAYPNAMAFAVAQSSPPQTPSRAPPRYASQELPLWSKYQRPPVLSSVDVAAVSME